jgi:2-hydroxychromene-2-carboxylate isomerase
MTQAEFWYEFASSYSYPAAMRVEALATERGVALVWRPFLLGPLFAGQGWRDSPFNLYPAKGRYMWRDIERICGALGLPLTRPDPLSRKTACWRRGRAGARPRASPIVQLSRLWGRIRPR